MLADKPITIRSLFSSFGKPIGINWFLTLLETAVMALVPLFIGMSIDGLLEQNYDALWQLIGILGVLILISVGRRIYDTRAFGGIRVRVCSTLAQRGEQLTTSVRNARLDMGRELVDFLEHEVPQLTNAFVQIIISLIVLYSFNPVLCFAALVTSVIILGMYGMVHRRFFRLNGVFNQQSEMQVEALESRSRVKILQHFRRLKDAEVRLSDTEALLFGSIFVFLLGFVVFNLWFASTHITVTTGAIFSIISYSWEFVESVLILPVTLQGWTRLTEIMQRINHQPQGNM